MYFFLIEYSSLSDITKVIELYQYFIISTFASLSSFCCVIFEIVIYYRFKRKKKFMNKDDLLIEEESCTNNSINTTLLFQRVNRRSDSLKKLLLLYLLIIILNSSNNFTFIYQQNLLKKESYPEYIKNGKKGFLLLTSTFFCFLILKYRIERYKKIGLIIIVSSLIVNGIISF